MWRGLIGLILILGGFLSVGCRQAARQEADLNATLETKLAPNNSGPILSSVPVATDTVPSSGTSPTTPQATIELGVENSEPGEKPSIGVIDVIDRDYRTQFIKAGDVLNVRSGPGVTYPIVGELAPGTAGIKANGSERIVGSSLWLQVENGGTSGWVNSRFLVEEVSSQEFCAEDGAKQIVDKLLEAVESENGLLLSELVEDGRSLRIRRNWWNPEIVLDPGHIPDLFTSTKAFDWGVADGSGQAITGTFDAVMKPLLENNLLGATEIGCNIFLHGGTAGFVQLPKSYEGMNFYTLYRAPGPDDFELDWGTWAVGIETWRGVHRLSFLVHYEWEI